MASRSKNIPNHTECSIRLFLLVSLDFQNLVMPTVHNLTEARRLSCCIRGTNRWIDRSFTWRHQCAEFFLQVSAAAAYYSTGVFVASRFWMLIAGATMIIAWLNLRYDSASIAQPC